MNLLVEACLGGGLGNQPEVSSPETARRGAWRPRCQHIYGFSTNAVDGSVGGIWHAVERTSRVPGLVRAKDHGRKQDRLRQASISLSEGEHSRWSNLDHGLPPGHRPCAGMATTPPGMILYPEAHWVWLSTVNCLVFRLPA